MANDNLNNDLELIHTDRTDQLDANDGMTHRNIIIRFFYHQLWSIKTFFNTIFAHHKTKDEDTIRRANEDYEAAHAENIGEVEDTTKTLLANEKVKTIEAINKFVKERDINVASYSSDDNFTAIADVLANGSDEKKKDSFYNLVSNRIKALNEAADKFTENSNDPKAIYDYFNKLEDTELCLQEYLDSHNAHRQAGKNREEFVRAILPMISHKREAFFDEYDETIKLQRDAETHAETAKKNKEIERENVTDFVKFQEEISDDEEEINISKSPEISDDESEISNVGMREKDDEIRSELNRKDSVGLTGKDNTSNVMTENNLECKHVGLQ